MIRLIEYLRSRLKQVVVVCAIVLALLVVIDAIPAIVDKRHAHTAVERIPGFWTAFGFLGCVFLILASKAFGKAGIMQREDYYDE